MIIRADARRLPLADNSVDLVVTSPPYYALRSYTDGGEHYDGQIGSEATPAEYVDNLIACTREWVRVLKPSGSLWLNLGDKYSGAQAQNVGGANRAGDSARTWRHKSLMGLPWRYALRCIDELGLILRAEVVWSKPNGLPESVTDRVRRSHEQWFHFTVSPRYYSAVDTIRQPHANPGKNYGPTGAGDTALRARDASIPKSAKPYDGPNPLGALPGSVWEIATQPLKVPAELGIDHFAAFPMEWPRRIIQGWSPSGVCTGCGEGRRPVTEASGTTQRERLREAGGTDRHDGAGRQGLDFKGSHNVWRRFTLTGEQCACSCTSAPTRPAVVLDPFGGTGTTALVAEALGRLGISVDMSADYCRLARWRTTDPGQIAAAMQVEKPPVQVDGQDNLLDLLGSP